MSLGAQRHGRRYPSSRPSPSHGAERMNRDLALEQRIDHRLVRPSSADPRRRACSSPGFPSGTNILLPATRDDAAKAATTPCWRESIKQHRVNGSPRPPAPPRRTVAAEMAGSSHWRRSRSSGLKRSRPPSLTVSSTAILPDGPGDAARHPQAGPATCRCWCWPLQTTTDRPGESRLKLAAARYAKLILPASPRGGSSLIGAWKSMASFEEVGAGLAQSCVSAPRARATLPRELAPRRLPGAADVAEASCCYADTSPRSRRLPRTAIGQRRLLPLHGDHRGAMRRVQLCWHEHEDRMPTLSTLRMLRLAMPAWMSKPLVAVLRTGCLRLHSSGSRRPSWSSRSGRWGVPAFGSQSGRQRCTNSPSCQISVTSPATARHKGVGAVGAR